LLIALEGRGQLSGEPFDAQDGWLLPAGAAIEITPETTLQLLRAYLPSPNS